jgi:hypothetical protein
MFITESPFLTYDMHIYPYLISAMKKDINLLMTKDSIYFQRYLKRRIKIHEGPSLFLFASENFFHSAEVLLKNGKNINIITNDGKTPLHLAIICGHWNMTMLLLENGATPYSYNKTYLTKNIIDLLPTYFLDNIDFFHILNQTKNPDDLLRIITADNDHKISRVYPSRRFTHDDYRTRNYFIIVESLLLYGVSVDEFSMRSIIDNHKFGFALYLIHKGAQVDDALLNEINIKYSCVGNILLCFLNKIKKNNCIIMHH